jgi:hypothetical protein
MVEDKNIKLGDVIKCNKHNYEIVHDPNTGELIAVFDHNRVLLYKYWDEAELIGNVKDNPELSCARIQLND